MGWHWARQASSKTPEHSVCKTKRSTARGVKCGSILRSASSRRIRETSGSRDAGLEPRRPHGPGSGSRLIHQRFLSWAIIGPDVPLRSSTLAAMRMDGRGEARNETGAARATEQRLIQAQGEGR